MPIIGFNINKIEAEKKKNPQGKVNVSNTPKIVSLEIVNAEGLGDLKKYIKVEYEFSIDYEPKIGSMKFSGDIMFIAPDQDGIVKQWKKDKKIPDYMMVEILNYLFKKIISRGIVIAEDLQLPPSIPFPAAQANAPEQKNPKYIE